MAIAALYCLAYRCLYDAWRAQCCWPASAIQLQPKRRQRIDFDWPNADSGMDAQALVSPGCQSSQPRAVLRHRLWRFDDCRRGVRAAN
eukprot:28247-Eustigmatos_ZCMA.PRE.1